MNILEKLKLDTWYGIVLYLGVLFLGASLFFKVDFLEEKHLFGLGLGACFIGLSFIIAEKKRNEFKPPNAYTGPAGIISWKETKHNFVTIILLIIGVFLISLFGYLIVKSLI